MEQQDGRMLPAGSGPYLSIRHPNWRSGQAGALNRPYVGHPLERINRCRRLTPLPNDERNAEQQAVEQAG